MQPQHQFDVDGNRNKLFAGLTKKLVSLEQEVLDKDAQLRAYRSRDSSLSLELHNATVALGQERGLLNLANATISKLESNLQEILPQLEHHLEQNRRVAHLEEQLAQSDASLEILRTKCESLSIFKEEQVNLEVSRTVSDREMLGSLIREVQSERTRAEQTRIRILDQVTSSKCAKKKRFHLLEYFNRWKHDNRFCRKYSELYLRSSQCHGVRLLRNALQNWRFLWPIGKYLSCNCAVRRLIPLLHSECMHGQERKCLSLRVLRNIGNARMVLKLWNRVAERMVSKDQPQLSADRFDTVMKSKSGVAAKKFKSLDSSKVGILVLNLRVKFVMKRLLLIWHYEAKYLEQHRRDEEYQNNADKIRAKLAAEMHVLEVQRISDQGEIDKFRMRSHNLAQKTVETLFGTNTKLMLQSTFNKLKNCALEGRSRKINELRDSILRVGQDTAFKLQQYEKAIEMANNCSFRRLLPWVAFLMWKEAAIVSQATNEATLLKARVSQLESPIRPLEPSQSVRNLGSIAPSTHEFVQSQRSDASNRRLEDNFSSPSSYVRRDVRGDNVEFLTLNQGQDQTLSQLASLLMPGIPNNGRAKVLEIEQAAPRNSFGNMNPQNAGLLDLQQKLNRLESRWASMRLSPS
jgi:hypothetical protein